MVDQIHDLHPESQAIEAVPGSVLPASAMSCRGAGRAKIPGTIGPKIHRYERRASAEIARNDLRSQRWIGIESAPLSHDYPWLRRVGSEGRPIGEQTIAIYVA